ncbi:MAG TPA: alpha/beta hydrolase [Streptosporangiaceae bacterium]|nr:alpha/beta hydrolase [Streptosporangiaceae bacterium]
MGQPAYDSFRARDGVSIAYRVSGQGIPVVAVHGYTVTSTTNLATHYSDDGSGNLVARSGPTIESALVEAGCQVVMLDLRGHGHSGRPHDPGSYGLEKCADDVRSLVAHLGLDQAALIGYSMGAWISCHLLSDLWVSKAGLCGVGTYYVEGQRPDFDAELDTIAKCFADGLWDEYPDYEFFRMTAGLDPCGPDHTALGLFAAAARPIPLSMLTAAPASLPVMVLNGGADFGADPDDDLTRFIPGARRVVAGDSHHGTAPSDPNFQAELVRFVLGQES